MTGFKNNGKLKLLIIVGTRPEMVRLAVAELAEAHHPGTRNVHGRLRLSESSDKLA